MNRFLIFCRQFYHPTYSFIANCIYWVFHLKYLKTSIRKSKRKFFSKEDVIEHLKTLTYSGNRFGGDWVPWVITVLNKDSGTCVDFAVLGKWMQRHRVFGKSVIIELWTSGKWSGHSVSYSFFDCSMVSNGEYVQFESMKWKKEIYEYFDGKYDMYSYSQGLDIEVFRKIGTLKPDLNNYPTIFQLLS